MHKTSKQIFKSHVTDIVSVLMYFFMFFLKVHCLYICSGYFSQF